MKAALCKSFDGPDAIAIETIEPGTVLPGHALVKVTAAALNFMDSLITKGKYQYKPPLPFSPAAEIAGIVTALGEGTTGIALGDRVCAYLGWGGAREEVVVAADRLIPVPDNVSDEVAAGTSVTYGTAFHGLRDRGKLKAGETVAVLGASGGAGLAAVEIAAGMGARVIAVASSSDKLALCKAHGARDLLNYKREDLRDGLLDRTEGQGVDVIYDCVGGDYAERALRAIAWEGRFLVVGFASGGIPQMPLNLALLKGCDICGVFWSKAVEKDPSRHRENMRDLLNWISEGSIQPHIHKCYPLEEIREAIAVIEGRRAKGKVVLTM